MHRQVRELAEREGVSMNQFIALAVAEKMSALATVGRGDRKKFDAVMRKAADIEPEGWDLL